MIIRGYASQGRRSRKLEEVASGKPEAYRSVLRQSRSARESSLPWPSLNHRGQRSTIAFIFLIDADCLANQPGQCRADLRDPISASGADVAEKARRERLLRHLESADKAHPLEMAKYSLERAGASPSEMDKSVRT